MTRPQQPELERSGTTDVDPDHAASVADAHERSAPAAEERGRPAAPEANRPGHHPRNESDQPDLDAFARRLGTKPPRSPGGLVVRLMVLPLRVGAGVLELAARSLRRISELIGER